MTKLELIQQIYHSIVDWEGELHWIRFHIDGHDLACKELEDYWMVFDYTTGAPIMQIFDDPLYDWIYPSEKAWLEQEVEQSW